VQGGNSEAAGFKVTQVGVSESDLSVGTDSPPDFVANYSKGRLAHCDLVGANQS